MDLNGFLDCAQIRGNLLIPAPPNNMLKNFQFPWRQSG